MFWFVHEFCDVRVLGMHLGIYTKVHGNIYEIYKEFNLIDIMEDTILCY